MNSAMQMNRCAAPASHLALPAGDCQLAPRAGTAPALRRAPHIGPVIF
jgi:hypothetical protein